MLLPPTSCLYVMRVRRRTTRVSLPLCCALLASDLDNLGLLHLSLGSPRSR
jgi:hypothetical protein